MPTDIHFVCRHGKNHKQVERTRFETGNWSIAEAVAAEVVGGRVYLHESQDTNAWHGGTILSWRASEVPGRVVFTYVVDGEFRIRCPGNWGQEKAIVRR